MSGHGRHTRRDRRRRTYGQNFLVSDELVGDLVAELRLRSDERVVETGAGRGALTIPLAEAGARVIAIERDPTWAERLRNAVHRRGLTHRVEVVVDDFRRFQFPTGDYRVVASPPYNLTTALLARLLDDPARGPRRADLVLQQEVARKRAQSPPSTLRSAAWAPWWEFSCGSTIPRDAFRPVPRVDSALLTITRRDPPVLPMWLAPEMRQLLRRGWSPPNR